MTISEHMLTGTPIVATKVDAIPYSITGSENGMRAEKDDWRVASHKVIELFQDECKRKKLIENRFGIC